MNIRNALLICFLFLGVPPVSAQSSPTDSLWQGLDQAEGDSARWYFLVQLCAKYYRTNSDSAILLGKRSLEYAQKEDKPSLKSTSLNTLGAAYWFKGDQDKALEYYFEALSIAEANGLRQAASTTLGNIGIIYSERQDLQNALKYQKQSLDIKKALGDTLGMARALTNIGLNLFREEHWDEALENYQEALKLARALNEKFGEGLLLGNIGAVYLEQEKYEQARSSIQQALEIRRELGDKSGIANDLNNIGATYLREGQIEKALVNFHEALEIAREVGSYTLLTLPYESLADAYRQQGDYRNAFEYQALLLDAKDSINNQEVIESVAEMETKYQTEQKEKELAQAELDLSRQRSTRNRILYGSLIAILALTSLVLFTRSRARLRKKQAELERAKAEKLQELDRIKSNFFANISHEFRTPLTLIKGPLKEMAEGRFQGDYEKYYHIMLRNSERLLNLINQLLDLSKLESGRMQLQLERGDAGRFINAIAHSFESLAARKQIQYAVEVGEGLQNAFFDRDKLEKILANLLSNAFKFTDEEGQVSLQAKGLENGRRLHLRIQDSGIGIPEKQLPFIFERFYSSGNSDKEMKSSGIGLALLKELVELHGGRIEVQSEEGQGAIFLVSLPIGESILKRGALVEPNEEAVDERPVANEDVMDTVEPVNALAPFASSEEIVLIVEDNDEVRQYIIDQLLGRYRVIQASNGLEGLDQATREVPSLVLTDVMMPEMDGVEFCRRLKEQEATSHIPIIMLTARAEQEDKLEGLEQGADDYLTKPFDGEELRLRVHNLLEQGRRWRTRFSKEVSFKPREVAVTSVDEAFLNRIVAVIEQNLEDETFGVPDLATALSLSRSQLHRKLKALSDKSPSQVIKDMRLQRAKDLLEKGAGNASEVAFMVGFNSLAYFSKCFKDA
ncbi:MAG: tetratricopeptide repeat protein, partial [Phaeodactylibacter sp.]|nr:tetratricopeptide repeat protein [Phaeodactylibacter sp.]